MSKPAFDTLLAQCRLPGAPVVVEAVPLSAEEAGRLTSALTPLNIQTRVLDGKHLTSKAALLHALATAFAFPSHFGHNWDALIDSWSDLSWLPAAGYVTVLLHADDFRTAHPRIHEEFVQVCSDVAQRWHDHDAKIVFKLVLG
jgi:RNAse (barnase) inhibitor barstar